MARARSRTAASDPRTGDWRPGADVTEIPGDPGVGGMLSDPEAPVSKHRKVVPAGNPTPDPPPPEAHGDWAPNKPWRGS